MELADGHGRGLGHHEPAALVPRQIRWFLVCRGPGRGWRVLRVDRITRASATGVRFEPREVLGGDPVAFVTGHLGAPPRKHTATILIYAPLEQGQAYMGGFATDFSPMTAATGQAATHRRIADVRRGVFAGGLLWVRWPFEVIDSSGLAALLRDRAAAFAADPC